MHGIMNVKELATIRQCFQSIVTFEDSKPLLGFVLPGTGRKFILKYSGTIVCGNDLSNVKITERFNVNQARMIVPRSRILDIYVDMKSIYVYNQESGIFTSIELQDQNREIAKNLEEARQEALQSDILHRADDNTRSILSSIALSMGIEAEVIFDDGQECIVHLSSINEESA
jgi:hypothetical protein